MDTSNRLDSSFLDSSYEAPIKGREFLVEDLVPVFSRPVLMPVEERILLGHTDGNAHDNVHVLNDFQSLGSKCE